GDKITCQGRCKSGFKTCQNGQLSECAGQDFPASTDPCNGIDDDCDGKVDEDCTCTPNTKASCYGGPAGTINDAGVGIGECRPGTQMCGSDMKFGPCTGDTQPKDEDCTNQGYDDDCDGKMDEVPGLGDPCGGSSGTCAGTNMCQSGTLMCIARQPQDESC